MIVHDTDAFGALYSTYQANREIDSLFLCMQACHTSVVQVHAGRSCRRITFFTDNERKSKSAYVKLVKAHSSHSTEV